MSLKSTIRTYLDTFRKAKDGMRWGMGALYKDEYPTGVHVKGEVFIEMRDARTGELLHQEHKQEGARV